MNGVATNTESEKVNKWQIYWIIRNKNDEKNNPFILKHLQRRTIYLSKLMWNTHLEFLTLLQMSHRHQSYPPQDNQKSNPIVSKLSSSACIKILKKH